MKWSTFLLDLSVAYMVYYVINIIYDVRMVKKSKNTQDKDNILFFEEHTEPQLIIPADAQLEELNASNEISEHAPPGARGIRTTGGVTLQQFVDLAKANLIEYTSSITY